MTWTDLRAPASPTAPVVGVALPIPEPWGSHLQRLRVGYGETRAHHIPTHVTLLPPTSVEAQDLQDLTEHLDEVAQRHPPFTVLLRGTGTFRPVSDVVFIQLAQGVASCERLEQDVRSGPVHRELQFPYHPHVTVVHDEPESILDRAFADLAAFTCTFTAQTFRLYSHQGDERWDVVREYRLRGE